MWINRNGRGEATLRARQGMVICVPVGSEIDDTRMLNFYDETYAFLCECGIAELV